MAFVAKDGSKHTNRDSMKMADAKHMAHQPAKPEHEQPADMGEIPEEGEGHDIGNLDELQDAFDQHLNEEAAGQPHDPKNIARLKKHFAQYADEEAHEGQ